MMSDFYFEHMIIGQQNLPAYASDPDTYDILYMTQAAAALYGFQDALSVLQTQKDGISLILQAVFHSL